VGHVVKKKKKLKKSLRLRPKRDVNGKKVIVKGEFWSAGCEIEKLRGGKMAIIGESLEESKDHNQKVGKKKQTGNRCVKEANSGGGRLNCNLTQTMGKKNRFKKRTALVCRGQNGREDKSKFCKNLLGWGSVICSK